VTGIAKALTITGVFVVLSAVGVFLVGKQYAGYTCIEHGVELLVPADKRAAAPEGYGVEIPEGTRSCRVTEGNNTYTEVELAWWDADEPAIVFAVAGLVLMAAGAVSARSRKRDEERKQTITTNV
jgi:hypothetical protein